jgi:hypothetical protein
VSLWEDTGSNGAELALFDRKRELKVSVLQGNARWTQDAHGAHLSREQVVGLVQALNAWLEPAKAEVPLAPGVLWQHADWAGDRVALERAGGTGVLLLRTLPAGGTSTTVLLHEKAARELGKLLLNPPPAKKWRVVKERPGAPCELRIAHDITLAWVNEDGLRIFSTLAHDLDNIEFGRAVQELLDVANEARQ